MTDVPAAPSVDRRAWLALVGGAVGGLAVSRPRRLRAQGREVIKVGSTLALPPFQFVDPPTGAPRHLTASRQRFAQLLRKRL